MAEAKHETTLDVPKDKLFDTITKYEDYPEFVTGCTRVEVERKGSGKTRVKYFVSMMGKDLNYVLDHEEDRENGTVTWELVESEFFTKNNGKWTLTANGDQTDAIYEIDLQFNFPVPGFILKKVVKGSLGPMVNSFGDRAENG